jgi:hypothetical protein
MCVHDDDVASLGDRIVSVISESSSVSSCASFGSL